MKRSLAELANHTFDLVVIGGGIFGVCAAWEARLRGLSVAIIERGDFGGGTSANSFKIVHGGIRYLQHGDIYRLRKSSGERRTWLRIAPHLVEPLPIVVPTYGHGRKSRALLRLGTGIYDLLTPDRNRGIKSVNHRIPACRSLTREQVVEFLPQIDSDRLTGGVLFHDGQIHNPPRLVLAVLRSAVEAGAVAANYVEADGLIRDRHGNVRGVVARDVVSGDELRIQGRAVLNAAGPVSEPFLATAARKSLDPPSTFSRDACFVVKKRLTGRYGLAVPTRNRDPDAVLSRGGRHLFLVPWREYTLVGVWHVVYTGDPDRFTVTDDEIRAFIDEVNTACPALDLKPGDVSLYNAGLVLFGSNPTDARDLRYAHRSRLIDHEKIHGIKGLVTLIGVRFTTGRSDAAAAVDIICRKLGRNSVKSASDATAVHGGDIDEFDDFMGRAISESRNELGIDVVTDLVRNYGSAYRDVLKIIAEDDRFGDAIAGTTTIKAQVVYSVREEMVETLEDVVMRRTGLGTGQYPGRESLETCASLMADELGWDADRIRREVDRTMARYPPNLVSRAHDSGQGS